MKKYRIIALMLALVLALTACGGAGTGGKDDNKVQGVTDTEIIVANTAATSGGYAAVGQPFNTGIEAYFKYVNENGGVHGRKIVFKHVDDEFAPDKGKAALQTMVEDEKVFAIVGHFGTPVVAATIEDLKEYGIPTVYFATGIGQLYNEKAEGRDRILYPVQPIYLTEGSIMVSRGVGDYKATKIGVIYTNDDAGKDMLEGAKAKATELKVDLVSEQVDPGATDVSAAVTSLLAEKPDFIIGASIQQTFPTIAKALNDQGNKAPVITTYVNVAPVIADSVKDAAANFDILGNGWVDFTQPTAVKELETYTKYMPQDLHANAYAITGWIAGLFFTEGLRRIPEGTEITWNSYMDALESKPILNPFGGEIDFGNGLRQGTSVMNLSKVNPATLQKAGDTVTGGWEEVKPLQSMKEILEGK
ncbi:MAG: ABC transporter substrate-binding protein [Tissierellia bacterium]|nr:ABC transporter substrate-binding protein [Tissierellia bacterium]